MSYKILILDDEDAIRNSLAKFFEDFGHQAFSVKSAEQAYSILNNNDIDVVIVDIRLPGLNGEEFINSVYDETNKTIFLIYTGSTEFHTDLEIKNKPRVSSKIFYKPLFDLNEFLNEIDNMLK